MKMIHLIISMFLIALVVVSISKAQEEEVIIIERPLRPINLVAVNDIIVNKTSKTVTDITGLTFTYEDLGFFTINDNRSFGFGMSGLINDIFTTRSTIDYEWNWSYIVEENNIVFIADNTDSNFHWLQIFNFSSLTGLKINHHIDNLYNDVENATFYYIFSVNGNDLYEFNDEYRVNLTGESLPIYKRSDELNLIKYKHYFNKEFVFDYEDIKAYDFLLKDVYVGSGSNFGIPGNILAIGFTKNNGFFPQDASVQIDPQFSTAELETMDVWAQRYNMVGIIAGDETADDATVWFYWTNGSQYNTFDMDSGVGTIGNTYHISGDAQDDDIFWVFYQDYGLDEQGMFAIANIDGTIYDTDTGFTADYMSGEVCVLTDNLAAGVAVDMVSSSSQDLEVQILSYSGGNVNDVDVDIYDSDMDDSQDAAIACANSTTFYVAYWDDQSGDTVQLLRYDVSGGDTLSDPPTCTASVRSGTDFHTKIDVGTDGNVYITNYDTDDDYLFTYVFDSTCTQVGTEHSSMTQAQQASTAQAVLNTTQPSVIVGGYDNDVTDGFYAEYIEFNESDAFEIITDKTLLLELSIGTYDGVTLGSYQHGTGIGLCNYGIVWAATYDTNEAYIDFINTSLQAWDGSCEAYAEPPANNPPQITTINVSSSDGIGNSDSNWNGSWTVTDDDNDDLYNTTWFNATNKLPILILDFNNGSVYDLSETQSEPTTNTGDITASGYKGQGLDFDGTEELIYPAHDSTQLDEVTIMGWVYLREYDATIDGLLRKNAATALAYELVIYQDELRMYIGDGASLYYANTTRPATDSWHHWAGTYDGTNIRVWLDGVEGTSGIHTGINKDSNTIQLGSVATNYMNAIIDDVKLYNYSMSHEQINMIYNDEYRLSTNETSAEEWWTFNLWVTDETDYQTNLSSFQVFADASTCTYSSADWNINNEVCEISTDTDISTNTLNILGSAPCGIILLSGATVTLGKRNVTSNCFVNVSDGVFNWTT